MIRVRSKDSRLGLLMGFIFGVVLVLVFIFLKFDSLSARFPIKEEAKLLTYSVLISARDIEAGQLITEDDFKLVNTSTYKDTGVTAEYLLGKKARIKIDKNIPISYEMLGEDETNDSKLRLYELDFVSVMKNIAVGDVVDLRISFTNGDDFTVLSAKEIKALNYINEQDNPLINLELDEREILYLASAYNDYRLLDGVRVYLAKYVDKNRQEKAKVNYPVNEFVAKIIEENADVKDKSIAGKRELIEACYDKQLETKMAFEESDDFDLTQEDFYDGTYEENDFDF